MTQNVRYCSGCGRASCGTCGRRAPSLRQDTQNLARSTGGEAGAWFWGILLGVGVLFWPTIFVHGPHRLPCEIGWYSFLGAVLLIVLICLICASVQASPKPKTGVPLVPVTPVPPEPVPPVTDLRFSREFDGSW